ncbi:nuclear pore complex component-domain-containing protein [Xylariales sp. PMI_506]|nr:nuclear pore complex component-domain-containing protein [Xylariales sp. PMI_506]
MSSSILQRPVPSVVTPTKNATAAPVQDSPGTWKHPRLAEIHRRQNATTFSEKNVRKIAWNVTAILAVFASKAIARKYLPTPSPSVASTLAYVYYIVLLIPLVNITLACLPLVRPKDDLSDIPLTPGQRKLLGLAPSSAPPTPGSVYSTPPRYLRTPSMSGSTGGSRRSFSNLESPSIFRSPMETNGGGNLGNIGSGYSPAGSPLIQKAMNGARRSSFGSSGSMMGKSFGASTASSIFGGVPDSPSPSPANGKRSSVGLNNKWLYERGRRTSGNAWS